MVPSRFFNVTIFTDVSDLSANSRQRTCRFTFDEAEALEQGVWQRYGARPVGHLGELLPGYSRQFERVESFFSRLRNADGSLAGGVNEYATPDEFKGLLRQHLAELLHRRAPPSSLGGKPTPIAATIPDAYIEWLTTTMSRR